MVKCHMCAIISTVVFNWKVSHMVLTECDLLVIAKFLVCYSIRVCIILRLMMIV